MNEEILKQNTDEDCQKWIKLVVLFSKSLPPVVSFVLVLLPVLFPLPVFPLTEKVAVNPPITTEDTDCVCRFPLYVNPFPRFTVAPLIDLAAILQVAVLSAVVLSSQQNLDVSIIPLFLCVG